jgi:E-phenylitaconyl-CoA hydratase
VPKATFGLSEVKRGLVPGNGGTQRVMQQFPYAIAMEILLIGDRFGTDLAERWGVVNAVVPPAKLLATARTYARRIAENAPLAVQAAKELAVRSRDMDLATGLRWEQATNTMLRFSKDLREGTKAFAEKRKPDFKGE